MLLHPNRRELMSQAGPRTVKTNAKGRHRTAHDRRELLAAQPIPRLETEQLTIVGWEPVERRNEVGVAVGRFGRERVSALLVDQAFGQRILTAQSPSLVKQQIARNHKQPGQRIGRDVRQSPPSDQEDLRRDIRGCAGSRPSRRVCKNGGQVGPVKQFEALTLGGVGTRHLGNVRIASERCVPEPNLLRDLRRSGRVPRGQGRIAKDIGAISSH